MEHKTFLLVCNSLLQSSTEADSSADTALDKWRDDRGLEVHETNFEPPQDKIHGCKKQNKINVGKQNNKIHAVMLYIIQII